MFNSILLIMTRGYTASNLHPKAPVLVIGTNLYTPTMFFFSPGGAIGTMAGGSNPTWDILRLQGSATPGVCTDHHRSMPTRSQTRYALIDLIWGMSMDFPASHAAWRYATFDDWRVKLVDPIFGSLVNDFLKDQWIIVDPSIKIRTTIFPVYAGLRGFIFASYHLRFSEHRGPQSQNCPGGSSFSP